MKFLKLNLRTPKIKTQKISNNEGNQTETPNNVLNFENSSF